MSSRGSFSGGVFIGTILGIILGVLFIHVLYVNGIATKKNNNKIGIKQDQITKKPFSPFTDKSIQIISAVIIIALIILIFGLPLYKFIKN